MNIHCGICAHNCRISAHKCRLFANRRFLGQFPIHRFSVLNSDLIAGSGRRNPTAIRRHSDSCRSGSMRRIVSQSRAFRLPARRLPQKMCKLLRRNPSDSRISGLRPIVNCPPRRSASLVDDGLEQKRTAGGRQNEAVPAGNQR